MRTVTIGEGRLAIEEVVALSCGEAQARLCPDPEFTRRIDAGARFLDDAIAARGNIYGVTTGYGDSCTRIVPRELYGELPIRLTRFPGCGLGELFEPEATRAILAMSSLMEGRRWRVSKSNVSTPQPSVAQYRAFPYR